MKKTSDQFNQTQDFAIEEEEAEFEGASQKNSFVLKTNEGLLSQYDSGTSRLESLKKGKQKNESSLILQKHIDNDRDEMNIRLRGAIDVFMQDEVTRSIQINKMEIIQLQKAPLEKPIQVASDKDEEYVEGQIMKQETIKQMVEQTDDVDRETEIFEDIKFSSSATMNRTLIHRCCLDQNFGLLKKNILNLISNSKSPTEAQQNILKIINTVDSYNNNPLALACIYQFKNDPGVKLKCIKFLLECKANPNVRNKVTGFTPLHWACRYNELSIVHALCSKGAVEYIPDFQGFTPIDYAGKFGSNDLKLYLIKRLFIKCHNAMAKQYKSLRTSTSMRADHIFPRRGSDASNGPDDGAASSEVEADFSDCEPVFRCENILLSPNLRSSLLYWACTLTEEELPYDTIKHIIKCLDAYPEYASDIHNGRTSLHAASIHGQEEKLKVLVKNLNKRYLKKDKESVGIMRKLSNKSKIQSEEGAGDQLNFFPEGLKKPFFAELKKHGLKNYVNLITKFENHLKTLQKHSTSANSNIDFTDNDGLSPLHYSCQNNQTSCTKILLVDSGASLDLSCKSGFRPREMLQYIEIKHIFQDFYNKIDQSSYVLTGVQSEQKAINIRGIFDKIQTQQYNEIKSESASQQEIEYPTPRTEDLINSICYKNLIKYYANRFSDNTTKVINQVLAKRNLLPEVSIYALLVDISQSKNKPTVNQAISTFVQSDFIVRVFPAASNPNHLFILLEMSQDALEAEAERQQYQLKLLEMDLKFSYIRQLKTLYEPFRTKDHIEIYVDIVKKVVQDMERKKILIKNFCIHDMNHINDIQQKFSDTSLRDIFRQSFFDNDQQEYPGLTSIKNYLGERWGYQLAFMQHYNSFLLVPSFFGIWCTSYIFYYQEFITLWSFAYSFLISVWITIFQERWKRKQNELQMIWGTTNQKAKTEIRPEFRGNEEFSHQNNQVNRKDVSKSGLKFKIINLLVVALFVSISVGSFFATKQYAGSYSGVLNSVLIGITNAAYKMSSSPMLNMENHKYEVEYISGFIQKIFVFQFINSNLSIIYLIYNDRDLQNLNTLLFGMVCTKVASQFFFRIILKGFRYHVQKKLYFNQCRKLSQIQRAAHEKNYIAKLNSEEKKEYEADNHIRKTVKLYGHLNMVDAHSYEYKRLITVFKKNGEGPLIEEEPYLVDQVELNSRMFDRSIELELLDISGTFILMSYASLYSFLCPIISFIILVYNLVTIYLERYVQLHYLVRKPQIFQVGIGAWMNVLKFLGYATIIMNSVFMYWFRDTFIHRVREYFIAFGFLFPAKKNISLLPVAQAEINAVIQEQQQQQDYFKFIILIVVQEHVVMILKFAMQSLIGDTPLWVQKHLVKVEHDFEQLSLKSKEYEKERTIEFLKEQMETQKESFVNLMEASAKKFLFIKDKYREASFELDTLVNQQQPTDLKQQKTAIIDRRSTYKKQLSSTGQTGQASLAQFFKERFSINLRPEIEAKLNVELNKQLQIRLFRQTFLQVERFILQRRIQKLSRYENRLIINCIQCSVRIANYQCHDCDNDSFCNRCFDKIHSKSTVLSKHRKTAFSNYVHQDTLPEFSGDQQKECEKEDCKGFHNWQKFEQFNYPLPEVNDMFEQLRFYFSYMKDIYLKFNNISKETQQTDIVKVLLDQNYQVLDEFLDKDVGKLIIETFKKEVRTNDSAGINEFEIACQDGQEGLLRWQIKSKNEGRSNLSTLLPDTEIFNDEEMLYLNRLAFSLLCVHGSSLQFLQFIEKLTLLQEGKFEDKVHLLLDMMKEGREGQKVIQIDKLIQFIMCSMPQDIHREFEAEAELISLFKTNSRIPFTDDPSSNFMTIKDVQQILLQCQSPCRNILECVLQCS